MRSLNRKELKTNGYNQQAGQYPNYINGQVNYPTRPQSRKKKVVYKKKGGKKKMARKRGGKSGKMFKLGGLNLLGIGFFFGIMYFSPSIIGYIQTTWASFNLPSLGVYSNLFFMVMLSIVLYSIAKHPKVSNVLRS